MTPPKPVFTPEMVKADAQTRIAKTAGQAGGATALVVVGQWVAQQIGWSGELPVEVFGALVTLFTIAGAWVTNLGRLRGEA